MLPWRWGGVCIFVSVVSRTEVSLGTGFRKDDENGTWFGDLRYGGEKGDGQPF